MRSPPATRTLPFKLIDASLQVAGLGAEPVGVAETLLRAHSGLGALRPGGRSFLLPEGYRRLTSARPGVGGIHLKSDCFPSRSAAERLGWRRPAGLGIPAPPGWLVGHLCSSFTSAHPRPAADSTREKPPGPAPAVLSPAAAAAVRLRRGPAGRRGEPNFFFEVDEARPLLACFLAA